MCPRSFGRQLTVLSYEDAATRDALAADQHQCFGWVPSVAVGRLGAILESCSSGGLRLGHCKSVDLTPDDAEAVLGSVDHTGFGVALKLLGASAREAWAAVSGSPPDGVARGSLWVAASEEQDEAAIRAFFEPVLRGSAGPPPPVAGYGAASASGRPALCGSATRSTAALSGCTTALVLPHAVSSGRAGAVLQQTLDGAASRGLRLTSALLVDLDPVTAAEYLEVYDGVEPSFPAMVDAAAKGPALALELCGADAVRKLREVAGPRDVDIARKVRPGTVRAVHGRDPARCGLHVTDLDEDGEVDSEYLFATL